jgi:hypothetical protein
MFDGSHSKPISSIYQRSASFELSDERSQEFRLIVMIQLLNASLRYDAVVVCSNDGFILLLFVLWHIARAVWTRGHLGHSRSPCTSTWTNYLSLVVRFSALCASFRDRSLFQTPTLKRVLGRHFRLVSLSKMITSRCVVCQKTEEAAAPQAAPLSRTSKQTPDRKDYYLFTTNFINAQVGVTASDRTYWTGLKVSHGKVLHGALSKVSKSQRYHTKNFTNMARKN